MKLIVIRKNEAWVRYRQLEASASLEEYRRLRSIFMKEMRRAKRGHEMAQAEKAKENQVIISILIDKE